MKKSTETTATSSTATKRPIEVTIAWAVEGDKIFTPMRYEIVNGEVVTETQCAPPGPYRAIAYQYLSGAILEYYNASQLKAKK